MSLGSGKWRGPTGTLCTSGKGEGGLAHSQSRKAVIEGYNGYIQHPTEGSLIQQSNASIPVTRPKRPAVLPHDFGAFLDFYTNITCAKRALSLQKDLHHKTHPIDTGDLRLNAQLL